MSESKSATVWLTCPQCRWQREFPQTALKSGVRCRQCGTVVLVCAPPLDVAGADLDPEPIQLPPTSGVEQVLTPTEQEYQLAPAPLPSPPSDIASTVPRGSVREEKQRDDVVEPPRRASLGWAFTNNVWEFPFHTYSVAQWLCVAIGLIISSELSLICVMGAVSGSMAGALQAGCFGIGAAWATLFTLSYAGTCLSDITINAAYNVDKAYDWPNPDWRERVWSLLRVAWVAVLAGTVAAGIAGLASFAGDVFQPVLFVSLHLLFPIFFLAALESDSHFWPISRPIFASVLKVWHAWILFFLITGITLLGCAALTISLFRRSNLQMPLVAGPLWAAAIFIYARLLGRLAWFILRKGYALQDHKSVTRMVEQKRWEM